MLPPDCISGFACLPDSMPVRQIRKSPQEKVRWEQSEPMPKFHRIQIACRYHQSRRQSSDRQCDQDRTSRDHKGFNTKHFSHTIRRHTDGHISRKLSFPLPDKPQCVGKYVGYSNQGKQCTQRPDHDLVSTQHSVIICLLLNTVFHLKCKRILKDVCQLCFNRIQLRQGSVFSASTRIERSGSAFPITSLICFHVESERN